MLQKYRWVLIILLLPILFFFLLYDIVCIRQLDESVINQWTNDTVKRFSEIEDNLIDNELKMKLVDIEKLLLAFKDYKDPLNNTIMLKVIERFDKKQIALVLVSKGKNEKIDNKIFDSDDFGIVFVWENKDELLSLVRFSQFNQYFNDPLLYDWILNARIDFN